MPNTTTISSFGHSPGLASLFLVVAAVLLTILAGLFLVAGALLGFIAREHTGNTLSYSMFTVAVVLLVLIVALLLLLLWIVLRGDTKFPVELLTVLPVLAQLPGALKATATALRAGATGLDLLQSVIDDAGDVLVEFTATAPDVPDDFVLTVTVPKFDKHQFGETDLYYVKNVGTEDKTVDLRKLKGELRKVGDALKANANSINDTERLLTEGARSLEAMATTLGSPP